MRSKNVDNAIVLMRIFDEIQWQKMPRISVKVIVSDYLYKSGKRKRMDKIILANYRKAA
jgi:hypothetical protein